MAMKTIAGLFPAVAAISLLLGAAGVALGADPRLKTCTTDGTGVVQVSFAMAHARDYQDHLPRMLRSPELEIDSPAYVVVFSGAVNSAFAGGAAAQPADSVVPADPQPATQSPATGVVCVSVDGSPTYYSNVDTTGLKP